MTDLIALVGVGIAAFAAIAAWRAAAAARMSTEVAEKAALLGSIPILVPWVDRTTTTLKVKNRGSATAHDIHWSITADGEERSKGPETDVINPGDSRDLTGSQDAIVSSLSTASQYVLRCEFITSWGEQLSVERTYIDGQAKSIRLFDENGRRLSIR